MKLLHFAQVDDGQVKFSNRKKFDQDIKAFNGMRIQIEIQKAKKGRSMEQNAYLWGVVYPTALKGFNDAGNFGLDENDMHRFFKDRFLSKAKDIIIPKTGETVKVSNTTTILTTTEMMDYIEQIAHFCAELLNTIIPLPNERQGTERDY